MPKPIVEYDPNPRADERAVFIRGGIRRGALADGGRRLTHPSGLEVIETTEQMAEELERLNEAVVEATEQRDEYAAEIAEEG